MSAYFKSINLDGFANGMYYQAMEELTHAKKFYDFIIQRGGRVALTAIDGPLTEWKSPLDVFKETLKHERKVTGLINDLVDVALKAKDHATHVFLQWFVTEQVEEESVGGVLEQLKLLKGESGGLFMMDRELGNRSMGGAEEE